MTRSKRWMILLSGIILNICLSGSNVFSVLSSQVVLDTGWNYGKVALAFIFYNCIDCVFAVVMGVLVSRFPLRLLLYLGATLFSIGWVLTGLAQSLSMFCFGFGVLSGTGCGLLYNFTATNAIKWFPDRKGFISGIMIGSSTIGPAFFAPLAAHLLKTMSVFSIWKLFGVMFGVLLFSVCWMISAPEAISSAPSHQVSPSSVPGEYCWRQMLKTPTFYRLFIVFVFASTPGVMLFGSVASVGQEQAGMSITQASIAVSLLAFSNFCGRLLLGYLSDKLGRYKTLVFAMSLCCFAILLLSQARQPALFFPCVCLAGLVGGAPMVLFPPITSERFGLKHSHLNYPIMFFAYGVSALTGPQLAAHFRDITGNYLLAFASAVIFLIAACILVLADRKMEQASTKHCLP